MIDRIYRHWVTAALVLGVAMLLLLLLLARRLEWNSFVILVYLQTPIYMLHQVEEHTGDRFRAFVNREIYGGVDALTPLTVLVVNVPGVWGVTLVSLYLTLCVGAGWCLIGLYLIAVNAVIHILAFVLKRKYNPGLWTAVLLFVPLSVLTLRSGAVRQATWMHHSIGLATALAIHAALVVHTRFRAMRLRRVAPSAR